LVLRQILKMRILSPARIRGFILYLPHFVKVFYRLMKDSRVPLGAKLVPWLCLALLLTPPALELDLVPVVGELDWLLVAFVALKLFVWLCPPDVVREHVAEVARGC
jgi:hypothetical protein